MFCLGDWYYTGLCPSEHSSGQTRRQGAITRHGNPRRRHLLVEAVWRLLKFQSQYRAIAKWHDPLTALRLTKARKKKIIVAIARQLAVALWRLATGRATAAALGLQVSPSTLERRAARPDPWVCSATPVLKDGAARHSFAPT